MAAAAAVLNTYELFEQIFDGADLTTKQLAKMQIVSSTWKDVVKDSTKFKEKLFLSPKALDSVLV